MCDNSIPRDTLRSHCLAVSTSPGNQLTCRRQLQTRVTTSLCVAAAASEENWGMSHRNRYKHILCSVEKREFKVDLPSVKNLMTAYSAVFSRYWIFFKPLTLDVEMSTYFLLGKKNIIWGLVATLMLTVAQVFLASQSPILEHTGNLCCAACLQIVFYLLWNDGHLKVADKFVGHARLIR